MASTEATFTSSNSNASDLIAQVEAISISSDNNAADQAAPESNVAACISMAQTAIKSRIYHSTKKLEKLLHKVMTPTLALDLKLDEVSSDLDRCFSRIRDQEDKRPSSYLPGACEEVALAEPMPVVVDSREALVEMLVSMAEALKTRDAAADLSVDLEGYCLSKDGDISLVQIFVHASNAVYLVHTAVPGAAAFSTSATIAGEASESTELTLKTILEASDVKKLWPVSGVVDVQLCDIATRETGKERAKIKSLSHAFPQRMARKLSAKAIEAWTLVTDIGIRTHYGGVTYEVTERLYIEAGGVIPQSNTRNDSVTEASEGEGKDPCKTDSEPKSYGEGVFAQSPIRPLLQAYAINDVGVLPVMYQHYTAHRFWTDKWETRVHDSSADRLVEGVGKRFNLTVEMPDKQKAPDGWRGVVQVDRSATS